MKIGRTYHPDHIWLLFIPVTTVALLLMFLPFLCTPFVLQPGIAVEGSPSPFLLPPQHNPLVVSITGPPLPAVFFDNQRATLQKLQSWLKSQQTHSRSIIIKADKYAPLGLVTDVLSQALRHQYSVILATEEKP